MQRSEVWRVDFDPSVGGEIQKQRPAVILRRFEEASQPRSDGSALNKR